MAIKIRDLLGTFSMPPTSRSSVVNSSWLWLPLTAHDEMIWMEICQEKTAILRKAPQVSNCVRGQRIYLRRPGGYNQYEQASQRLHAAREAIRYHKTRTMQGGVKCHMAVTDFQTCTYPNISLAADEEQKLIEPIFPCFEN